MTEGVPLRIGIDIRTIDAASGQQRYLWRLATWLADRGEEVEVLSTRSGDSAVPPHPRRRVHSLKGLRGGALRAAVRALDLDVFFANPERADAYRGLPMHVLRPGYGTRQGIQNLRSVRNPWLRAGYALARAAPWERLALARERAWYAQTRPAPHVIAISERMARAIRADYGVPAERVHVVHNGVDLEEFSPLRRVEARAAERARLGIEPEAVCLLFVGHNFRRKGLLELLDALAGLGPAGASVRLLVAGRGTGEGQRRRTRAHVARSGLEDRVRFAGDVRPVSRAYAAADALVFPSWHDAFGFVVLEAMASGLPVVTTRFAGAHEVVRSGVDGFVLDAPDHRSALDAALRGLLDAGVRDAMGAAARAQAEHYGEEANFEQVYRVIREAARG
ncbi:MAG: glycosyltransferase family 4 protein [Gemmatimonadota bacterium]